MKGPVNYNLSGWTLELYAPNSNPLGAIPGSNVSYEMTTSMIQFGISYKFLKTKETN